MSYLATIMTKKRKKHLQTQKKLHVTAIAVVPVKSKLVEVANLLPQFFFITILYLKIEYIFYKFISYFKLYFQTSEWYLKLC